MRYAFSLLFITAASLPAAPTFSTDAGSGSVGDLFDISQGSRVISSSPVLQFGGEDIREAFGGNGGVENTNVMFADAQPPGFVDFVEWQTQNWINVSSVELRFSQDGGDANRSTAAYNLFSTQDGVNYTSISSGSVPLVAGPGSAMVNAPLLISDLALGPASSNVRGFRLEVTRNTGNGPRMVEIDGTGSIGTQTTNYLDRLAFNAASNGAWTGQIPDDQTAGSASGFTFSSAVGGGDSVEDAFGNRNGLIEPETFIFGDGGTVDNGNGIFGDGGETVDFIAWNTAAPLTVAGFKIGLSGDGLSPDRDTEMIRFLVEGVEVDLYDNNGFDGDLTRLFGGGAVIGDDFRIEFTRRTGAGARIFEIDAILGVVPEPSAAALFGIAGGAMLLRRRARSPKDI